MNRLLVATSCAALAGAAVTGAYVGVVTGRLTFDLGLGRRTRPLGPLHVDIAAPRETVFAVAAAPYADRQLRAMGAKVEILERAGQMVLAAHRTVVGSGLTALTVETVTLDPPNRMGFRFHPTYLVAAVVVLGLGWPMNRIASPAARPARLELRDTPLHG